VIGQRLAHYQIVEKLGEGGMGVVYKARDTHLDRFVAIKVLPPERVADPSRKSRFVQEAKAASALNHPNIVTIHDIATDAGHDFIAMEHIEGRTLADLIGRKGLPLNQALKIGIQIADALAKAHAKGIIHRDLKPTNVMVTTDGVAKVLDFGLAKLTEVRPEDETLTLRTEEGSILGTAAYMSPEQAQGKVLDARSDIFSFGSVLYEMATGRRAFESDSKMSTLAAIINREPKPLTGVVPAGLERLIQKCLRKDPARRFQHIDDVKSVLEDLKEESDSGKLAAEAAPPPRRGKTMILVAGLAALVTALAAGVAYYLLRGTGLEEAVQVVPLTSDPGVEMQPSFSPDGNQVTYASDADNGNFDIYVKLIGAEKPLRLTTDPAADVSPAWSPDGRWIAFVRLLRVREIAPDYATWLLLIPAIGGPERKLAEGRTAASPSGEPRRPSIGWSPDSRWLAMSQVSTEVSSDSERTQLELISVETGERRALNKPPMDANWGDGTPAFSPDGRTLAFCRCLTPGVYDIYRLRLTRELTPAAREEKWTSMMEACLYPAWTADGREIVFSCGQPFGGGTTRLWRMNPDRPGQARRLEYAGNDCAEPAIARKARRLAYTKQSEDSNIWAIQKGADGKYAPAVRFIESSYLESVPRFSPDGRKIVFTSSRSGFPELWVCDGDGKNPQQLTTLMAPQAGSARWSPDGRWIIFDSNDGGKYALYQIPSGGGMPKRVMSGETQEATVFWSGDGRHIYFTSNRSGRWEVWKMPFGGGTAVQITRNGGLGPVESPDGKYIYYYKPGGLALWSMPVEGGDEREVLPAASYLSFVVRPEGIYYLTVRDAAGRTAIMLRRTNGLTETLTTISMPSGTGLDVSKDGSTILYTVFDRKSSDLMLVENFR
jgi:Tol biopolymer transport system component/tRNA A-37 threonylcarbamoyl transferase component Bud32